MMSIEDAIAHADRVPGWMTRAELGALVRLGQRCAVIVEIGAWYGRSTRALALGTPAQVFAVDVWGGEPATPALAAEIDAAGGWDAIRRAFRQNLSVEIALGKVIPVQASSSAAASSWQGPPPDFVFIDGAHDYASVRADIAAWVPVLRPGGLLAGHDYNPKRWPGVIRAVDECFPDREITPDGSIWHVRPTAQAAPAHP